MKPLPMLLLNLALVVAAVVVYDQLRSDPVREDTVVTSTKTDPAVLDRLDTLEAERRPLLQGPDPLPAMLERLDAMEATLARLEEAAEKSVPVASEQTPAERVAAALSTEEPTTEEIQRFRQLQQAVKRQERLERTAKRMSGALDKLALNLTERQRAKILEAFMDFEPRRNEIWIAIKTEAAEIAASGGQVNGMELRTKGSTMIQQAFTETITGIVSHADAEVISQALLGK